MKAKTWRFGLCALLCAVLILPMASWADFGSFAGDSDYGTQDDYSGSSRGSDSDWDDDGGGGPPVSFGAAAFGTAAALTWFLWTERKKKRKRKKTGVQSTRADAARPVPSSDAPLSPLAQYNEIDPLFSRAALSEKLANLYVQMQNAWQEKDIESVRPYLTDTLFTQMERQLNAMRRQGRTNYIDRITVLGVELLGYYQSGGEDHIVARLRTRIVDYTLEDKTGKLVSGDQRKERFMTYE